jgi:methylmalonyl-CoA mutase cobalamin-binding domain/chain
MLRLLVVIDPALADQPVAGAVPRSLRDGGHEVVHAGGLTSPEEIAAAAVQEDVDAVVLLDAVEGGQVAGLVGVLLEEGGVDDIAVLGLGPSVTGAEALERVRRSAGS